MSTGKNLFSKVNAWDCVNANSSPGFGGDVITHFNENLQ